MTELDSAAPLPPKKVKPGRPDLKRPAAFSVSKVGRFSFLPIAKSSSPKAGAICTRPVPSSVSTKSAPTTRYKSRSSLKRNGGSYFNPIRDLPERFSTIEKSPSASWCGGVADQRYSYPSLVILNLYFVYSSFGLTATAAFPGKVQGVVVQIKRNSFLEPLRGNFTYTESSSWSRYELSMAISKFESGVSHRGQKRDIRESLHTNPFL